MQYLCLPHATDIYFFFMYVHHLLFSNITEIPFSTESEHKY